jgi:hypothetical protein
MTIQIKRATNVTVIGRHIGGNCKPVFCITDGSVYASVTDAAEKNGIHFVSISNVCLNKQRHANGKRYCFVSDVMEHLDEISENIKVRNEKVMSYDAMIAEQAAKKEAQEKLAKHKAKCEELRAKLAREEQLMKEAEELCNG